MNDPDTQKNMILAIVLSLAVLLGWQYLFVWPKEQERRRQAQEQQVTVPTAQTANATGGAQQGQPGPLPAVGAQATGMTRDAAIALSPRLKIDTPSLVGSIALKGGRIDDLTLAKYRETTEPNSPTVILLEPSAAKDGYFAEFGWVPDAGQSVTVPDRDTLWTQLSQGALTPTNPAVLGFDNGQGLYFRRTISVDDRYMFTIRDEVENKSNAVVALKPFGRIYRVGLPKTSGYAVLHEGLVGVLSPDSSVGLQEVGYNDLIKEATAREKERKSAIGEKNFADTKAGWLGFTDKYWAAVLVPPQNIPYFAHLIGYKAVSGTQEEAFQADYTLPPVSIAAGATQSTQSQLFAGAKEVRTINAYGEAGIKRFDLMIDWGWSHFIAKPMFWLLDRLSQILGNFGLAILAVTVLAKAAFFPLANKSYESMAKMKKMQPEMERIKEQYKDDREKQQKEMMRLYQEHKINPASGCLPMLLQFPVFFALYKVLLITIDMRQAKFYGWIKDLSAADPSNLFNLFGLLPFDPTHLPAFGSYLHLGFWPLVMGATMWMTMQLNPQQADPMQQKIFNWMPVIFTFTMAGFPAGLVIYWAWSNVLSLIQQYYIMHKNGADIHLWKNLGVDKWISGAKKT